MNDYIEDRLAGRRIFWCPGGQGNLAYCPQPTNPDDYTFCCAYYYLSQDMPTCCRWPWHTGAMMALLISGILITLLLAFFTCWCCPCCPLAKRLMENRKLRFASEWKEATVAQQMITQPPRIHLRLSLDAHNPRPASFNENVGSGTISDEYTLPFTKPANDIELPVPTAQYFNPSSKVLRATLPAYSQVLDACLRRDFRKQRSDSSGQQSKMVVGTDYMEEQRLAEIAGTDA